MGPGYDYGATEAGDAVRLRGLKAFELSGTQLRGTTMPVTWKRGKNVAECIAGDMDEPHTVPDINCSCGRYAWWRLEDEHVAGHGVLAVASGSGLCFVGELGFRSECMELLALSPNPTAPPIVVPSMARLKKVARRYGVPLLPNPDAMLDAFPLQALAVN
jgi:hypothetical protein